MTNMTYLKTVRLWRRVFAYMIIMILLFAGIRPAAVLAAEAGAADASVSDPDPEEEDPEDEPDYSDPEVRRSLPVDSNSIKDWPAGPELSALSAVLLEAQTGTVLYAKNKDMELYPASTTKLMTCLIAMENGSLDDMVEFSYEAVHSVPYDGSSIGMDAGESITLEQCLYGIMVGSANEVANAVAEHIAGSIDEFVDMMNERAKELGCEHTHFVNTNGLHDEAHYTSAYDLALIGRAYFSNEALARIANTPRYHFEPTDTQPDDFYLKNKHQLINGEIEYEGIKGGKTGYTSNSGQTLVTCCEQSGMKLVCVVMMEQAPDQFNDTVTLFNYGYSNFSLAKVIDNETGYTTDTGSFFTTGSDIFGNSTPFLALDSTSSIVLPTTVEFSDLESSVSYDVDGDAVARITYSLNGVTLGEAYVLPRENAQPDYEFEHVSPEEIEEERSQIAIERSGRVIFLNVRLIVVTVVIIALTLAMIITIIKITREYHFAKKKNKHKKTRRRGGRRGDMYI